MATVSARGRIHVIGGRTDDRDDNVGDHDIYDPKTNSWSAGPPLPTPRSGGQSAVVGNLIVVYGGENSKKTFDEVEAYDLDRDAWITFARAPTGLHASSGATIGKTVYFPGGSTGPGGDAITAQLLTFSLR
jgi:N-acetylneuraminic acid mutarotase